MIGDRPVARKRGLLVRDLGEDVVLYDVDTHLGYSLNRTAALVWRASNGRRTVSAIADRLGRELGIPPSEPLVAYTLRRLRAARLMEPGSSQDDTLTRRQLIPRIGAAALLPVVSSLLAPTPSEAATCVSNCTGKPNFTQCNYGPQASCAADVCCGQSCCDACPGGIQQLPCN